MESILREIERALDAKLYYLAIVAALSLPDVCASLESPDGTTSGSRYKAWVDAWLANTYPMITGTDLYSLRCGVVHQGRMGHEKMQYDRIVFTLPGGGVSVHRNFLFLGGDRYGVLNLDAAIFCRDVVNAVSTWYAAKHNDPHVQANMPRVLQFHPQGLLPYISGVPVIA